MSTAASAATRAGSAGRAAGPATPKVGFVSLGCPKALVDSERIITKLRSERYATPRLRRCRRRRRQRGFLNSAKEESLADRRGDGRERARHRHGLHGRGGGRIRAAHPGVLAVTGPRSTSRSSPPCTRRCRRCTIPRRSGATRGHPPHAAPLRVFEDLRRLQQPLHVLHHPEPLRGPREPAAAASAKAEAERLASAARSCSSSPGQQRLRPRPALRDEPWKKWSSPRASSTSLGHRRIGAGCGCTTSTLSARR